MSIDGKDFCNSFYYEDFPNKIEAKIAADKWLFSICKLHNKLKNRIRYLDKDTLEVELTNEKYMKIDSSKIDIINRFPLVAKNKKKGNKFYVCYSEKKISKSFHELIGDYKTIGFVNGDTLDLRSENLRNKGIDDLIKMDNLNDNLDHNTENAKYAGTIFCRKNGNAWNIVIKNKGQVYSKYITFDQSNKEEKYKEAQKIKIKLSNQLGLTKYT